MLNEISIDRRLTRIEKMLSELLAQKSAQNWVKAGDIMAMTGWDREKMRRMRNDGILRIKREKGIWYDANSVPSAYLQLRTA